MKRVGGACHSAAQICHLPGLLNQRRLAPEHEGRGAYTTLLKAEERKTWPLSWGGGGREREGGREGERAREKKGWRAGGQILKPEVPWALAVISQS